MSWRRFHGEDLSISTYLLVNNFYSISSFTFSSTCTFEIGQHGGVVFSACSISDIFPAEEI